MTPDFINRLLADETAISADHYNALGELTCRHPYFTLGWYALWLATQDAWQRGMIAEADYHRTERAVRGRIALKPYPQMLMPIGQPEPQNEYSLIDSFLQNDAPWAGPQRFDEEEAPYDLSVDSVVPDEETISETLAQIYLTQGHRDKAVDIYYKLSLKYPEKSIYFATLIEQLNENQ